MAIKPINNLQTIDVKKSDSKRQSYQRNSKQNIEREIKQKVEEYIKKELKQKVKQEVEYEVEKDLNKSTNFLLAKSEISIWIDTYDDIFSDFDPRPYRERAISVDFLEEAKRYSHEKHGKLQLRILAPRQIRNTRMEVVIKKRLSDYFKHHFDLINKERSEDLKQGFKLASLGIVLLFSAALVMQYAPAEF